MDLAELQEIAEQERRARKPIRIRCCVAAGCLSANAQTVKQQLEAAVAAAGMEDRVEVCGVGCMRLCSRGPLAQVDPDGALYANVTPASAPLVIAAIDGGGDGAPERVDSNLPFFTRQLPIVFVNSGKAATE